MKRPSRRKQRKTGKQRRSAGSDRNKSARLRTVEEFFAMSEQDRDLWNNVGQAVTEVRTGVSLRQAARKFGLDPRTVRRLAQPALRKLRNGRWAAKAHDRLLRVLVIPTRKGLSEIGVLDSRQASLLGKYWTAVERYRDTGDASALREFRGKYIVDAGKKRVPLLTNPRELDRLGSAGVLSFESLYARAA
ncbi:MAG: hypothetical protein ACYDDS_21425 [Candidatus Sulfotelmatobacter sp.]|jgi:hypothetical protein